MFNDPSGEFIFAVLSALIIGTVVGVASYTIGLAITGNLYQWNLGRALKSALWGAVSSAITFGIGEVFSTTLKTGLSVADTLKESIGKVGLALVRAGTHAVSQGVLAVMQGTDVKTAMIGSFLGSLGADAWGVAMKGLGYEKFAESTLGMVAFGTLSGSIGAELTGGNFWQGAVTAGIVAGLNHAMHKIKIIENKTPPKSMTKEQHEEYLLKQGYLSDGPIQMMGGPFDPLGVVEGGIMLLESYLTDNVNSVFAKGVGFIASAKLGGWRNNILTNTTTKGTTLLKTSNKNFRVDLDIKHGIHYHRRGMKLPNGATKSGQGISRHIPWERKSSDKSFWDRF